MMRKDIRLVIADVDGTLVTQDKVLTPRAMDLLRNAVMMNIFSDETRRNPYRH